MSRRITATLLTAASALCIWQIWSFHSVRQDDPFITYRYAQNLVHGHGLVFNPGAGQRLLGATSPGHIFLSALVYSLFGIELTPSIMAALGCMAWSAQAVAAYALLATTFGPFTAGVAALVVDIGGAESFKWVPFETNIAAAFALFALVALKKERHALSGLLLALGALSRPDVLLLAALVYGSYPLRRAQGALRSLAAFVPLVAGWIGFATAYFGTALPHSAVEKFQRTTLYTYLEHGFLHVGAIVVPLGRNVWLALCAWLLCLSGAFMLSRRDSVLSIWSLYALLHLAAYTFLRPFVEHEWHLYPSVLGGVVVAVGGLAWLSRGASKRLTRVGSALVLSCLVGGASLRSLRATRDLPNDYWTGARDAAYRRVAQYLRENLHAQDEFASVEVGTIAYYSDRSAYDLGGLITNLKADPMAQHPVRFLVLDSKYLYTAPPWPPVHSESEGLFRAFVFRMPVLQGVSRAADVTRSLPATSR